MGKIGESDKANFCRIEPIKPKLNPEDLFGVLPRSRADQYDMNEIINRVADEGSVIEYKKDYGKTIITSYARIDGWAVGIVITKENL